MSTLREKCHETMRRIVLRIDLQRLVEQRLELFPVLCGHRDPGRQCDIGARRLAALKFDRAFEMFPRPFRRAAEACAETLHRDHRLVQCPAVPILVQRQRPLEQGSNGW